VYCARNEEGLLLLEIKRFDSADEERTFDRGGFQLLQVGGMTLGRATYEPGWKWSEHVGSVTGESLCQVEHIGIVLAGRAAVAMADGTQMELHAGDVFAIPPGHDSWVVGDEAYTSLHLLGAEDYADTKDYAQEEDEAPREEFD
jgi:quercetin dioxygenase-like cupin family protein